MQRDTSRLTSPCLPVHAGMMPLEDHFMRCLKAAVSLWLTGANLCAMRHLRKECHIELTVWHLHAVLQAHAGAQDPAV